MGKARSKLPLLATGAMLVCAGAGFGVLASSLTSNSIAWRPPARFHIVESRPDLARVDQAAAGQAWARSAFWGGLRRCPALNDAFVTACEAEIKALAERPDFAGSYSAPLLVTTIEHVGMEPYRPAEPDVQDASYVPVKIVRERTPDNYPAAPATEPVTASESAPSIPR